MVRVTFDRHYMDNLQDYYRRNECIREQQYLSQDRLLHLAAFCMSKVAVAADDRGDARRDEQKVEAAVDVIRQLSSLCEKEDQAEEPIRSFVSSTVIVLGARWNEAAIIASGGFSILYGVVSIWGGQLLWLNSWHGQATEMNRLIILSY